MMDECRRTAERLTPFVDEALEPGERTEVEQHLNVCPPCQQDAVEERGGRTVLRECADRLRTHPLPPGLRSRCEALAHEHQRVATAAGWRMRFVPGALVALVLFFTGMAVLSLVTRRSDTVLAAQLTADHVKCFEAFASGTVRAADAQQVEALLESRYGWDMHVPPSSPGDGLTLIGGRRCMYADGRVPHVMYRSADAQPVSLFRLQGVSRRATDVISFGHHSRIWSRDGNTYVLVGPAGAQDWTRIARYVEREAR